MHSGNRVLLGCSESPVILPQSPQMCQNGCLTVLSSIEETEKSRVGRVLQSLSFWSKTPWWKKKCEKVRRHDATASSFVAKVRGEVFAHFHAVAVKLHNSMRNGLFGLPRWILCEQSPWCRRILWACSWLCSSPVSPLSVCPEPSMPFKHQCMAYTFFPASLSNYYRLSLRTFSEIYTKCDAHSLSVLSRNHIRGQIQGSK
jgi:hypothetical protein